MITNNRISFYITRKIHLPTNSRTRCKKEGRKRKQSLRNKQRNYCRATSTWNNYIRSEPKKKGRNKKKKKEHEVEFHSDERRIGDVTREQTTLKLQNTANCFLLADIQQRESRIGRRGRECIRFAK